MNCRCCTPLLYRPCKRPVLRSEPASDLGALGGTRTPSLLIRSQMLYPLSYERWRPLVYGTSGGRRARPTSPLEAGLVTLGSDLCLDPLWTDGLSES
jgi:hypothetical protein